MIYHGGPSWNTEGITGGHHGGGGGGSGDFGPCREDLFDPLFVNEQGMLSRHPCVHRYRRIVNKTMADAHAPDHWCSTSTKGTPKAAPPPQPWWQRQQQQQQQQQQQSPSSPSSSTFSPTALPPLPHPSSSSSSSPSSSSDAIHRAVHAVDLLFRPNNSALSTFSAVSTGASLDSTSIEATTSAVAPLYASPQKTSKAAAASAAAMHLAQAQGKEERMRNLLETYVTPYPFPFPTTRTPPPLIHPLYSPLEPSFR